MVYFNIFFTVVEPIQYNCVDSWGLKEHIRTLIESIIKRKCTRKATDTP